MTLNPPPYTNLTAGVWGNKKNAQKNILFVLQIGYRAVYRVFIE